MSWMKVNRWKVVELNLYEIERIGWEMNEMSEMNLRRVSVSPYESEWESPYESECESPYQKVPIKLSVKCPYRNVHIRKSLSKCPYQNVHIKISILPFMIQIVVLLELGWASIQQPIIKSIILIDLNEHLKNLEDSLDRHRAWRHTKVI